MKKNLKNISQAVIMQYGYVGLTDRITEYVRAENPMSDEGLIARAEKMSQAGRAAS